MIGIRHIAAALTVALSFTATGALGQAFGIEKGTPLEVFEKAQPLQNGLYMVSVPSPHPEFSSYAVKATPTTGVCLVKGVGKDHDNDRFGNAVRDAFASLRKALESRYGAHYFGDFLRHGSIWNKSNEWVMSIRQNERVYQAAWDAEEGSNLTGGLTSIILGVKATSSSSAWIILQYRFENDPECDAMIGSQNEGGL